MNSESSSAKLKGKDVKGTRLALLEQQNYLCAICNLGCTEDQAVLDHNHKEGYIRAVLHRGCNAVEGKVVNAMRRYAIKDPTAFLLGLVEYHRTHSSNQTKLIHPTFKTPEQRLEATKARAKKKRLALKKAKTAIPK